MKSRLFGLVLFGLGSVVGGAAALRSPELAAPFRTWLDGPPPPATPPAPAGHGHGRAGGHGGDHAAEEGRIRLTAAQIAAARIALAKAGPGALSLHVTAPAVVQPDPDRVARIAGRVVGTVAALKKRLGDRVEANEVIAILDSREVAEAKSEFFAARTNLDLQQTLFEREQSLWDKRVSAEQQYLRARTTLTEVQLRLELAMQKLAALGLTGEEIAALERRPLRSASDAPAGEPARQASWRPALSGLQLYAIRSPIAGQVTERLVDLGAPIGVEGVAKELYVVADLSSVWIELAIPVGDLGRLRQGQKVAIASADGSTAEGRLVFVSPILNPESRSARVVAEVPNPNLAWRPGAYVTARVTLAEEPVGLRIPKSALQTIGGEQVVFVRTTEGFETREVAVGRSDDESVEIVFGLDPDEEVAAAGSFTLKAELGKAEAEHAH